MNAPCSARMTTIRTWLLSFGLVLMPLALGALANPSRGVHDFFGAFKCSTGVGPTRYMNFGPTSRHVHALSDPVAPLSMAWGTESGESKSVTAVVLVGGMVQINGVPGGALMLSLIRPVPDYDDDLDPFVLLSDQSGHDYLCGYYSP